MSIGSLICFALAAGIAAWVAMIWRGLSQDWLPDELKAGKVVAVEEDLTADEPFAVIGRPDQVFKVRTGQHVLVELKNRDSHRVYDTDVAEISLRAWLLRRNGQETASYGYIAVNQRSTGKREAIKVDLKSDEFCEKLIARYIEILEGRSWPRKARGPKCKSCGHATRCAGEANS